MRKGSVGNLYTCNLASDAAASRRPNALLFCRGVQLIVVNAKLLPNLLSGTRIVLMPAVLTAAIVGSRGWFVALLAASLATDALDGFFARRFNAFSEFGRKLDSAADYLTLVVGLAGIALLWPVIMRRELPWVAAGVGMFFIVLGYAFWRLGRLPYYHTWMSKVGVAGCALALIPLLAGWTAVPFHVAMVVLMVGGVEEFAIASLIPWHRGEVRTVWHAWRMHRSREKAESSATRIPVSTGRD